MKLTETDWGKFLLPIPIVVGASAAFALIWVFLLASHKPLSLRNPGADAASEITADSSTNAVLLGKLILGEAQPTAQLTDLPGAWPGFRGSKRDDISPEPLKPGKPWDGDAPKELWSIEVGEGYAGPAVRDGRVYLMDYDVAKRQDALRCLSLADGKEIWRYAYPVKVKRNHGYSRTVPALADKYVVAIGPKCHVVCLDAQSGELRWGFDMVREYGATVPPWYAGQCPLIDDGKVILAPGGTNAFGTNALLVALELATGKTVWQTPNSNNWLMTHSSVMPMQFAGERMYVYCASLGVVGVSASNGALLWQTTDWKISFANVPSPVCFPDGRIFLSGGYGAGSLMIQLQEKNGHFTVTNLYKLDPKVFGAAQHTPILYQDHLYGIRPDGQLVCLDTNGKLLWNSTPANQFGLGPFMLASKTLLALSEKGKLSAIEVTPEKYNLLGHAQVLPGHEAWAPMALAGNRLLVRDTTRMTCLELGGN